MTHRGPFQPLPFCDSVINQYVSEYSDNVPDSCLLSFNNLLAQTLRDCYTPYRLELSRLPEVYFSS